MGDKKTGRLYIRVDPDWLEQVQAAAKALSLDLSAYVTLAISERMRKDQQESAPAAPPPAPKRSRKK